MPNYCFVCHECGHTEQVFLWYSEEHPKHCPLCASEWARDFMAESPLGLCKGEDRATTFGQQSEYNLKRLGKEKTEMMLEEMKTSREKLRPKEAKTPWWRDGTIPGTKASDKPIDTREIKDVEKYIITGEKT